MQTRFVCLHPCTLVGGETERAAILIVKKTNYQSRRCLAALHEHNCDMTTCSSFKQLFPRKVPSADFRQTSSTRVLKGYLFDWFVRMTQRHSFSPGIGSWVPTSNYWQTDQPKRSKETGGLPNCTALLLREPPAAQALHLCQTLLQLSYEVTVQKEIDLAPVGPKAAATNTSSNVQLLHAVLTKTNNKGWYWSETWSTLHFNYSQARRVCLCMCWRNHCTKTPQELARTFLWKRVNLCVSPQKHAAHTRNFCLTCIFRIRHEPDRPHRQRRASPVPIPRGLVHQHFKDSAFPLCLDTSMHLVISGEAQLCQKNFLSKWNVLTWNDN